MKRSASFTELETIYEEYKTAASHLDKAFKLFGEKREAVITQGFLIADERSDGDEYMRINERLQAALEVDAYIAVELDKRRRKKREME